MILIFTAPIFPQQPPVTQERAAKVDSVEADSSKTAFALPDSVAADSTAARATLADSLKQKKKPVRPTPRISPDRLPESKLTAIFRRDSLGTVFHEDLAELVATLPGVRVLRTGDLGHASFAGFQGDPQRFTSIEFDGIVWPVGVYGQTNLAELPEVAADEIYLNPETSRLNFKSFSQPTPVPWTFAEYAVAPFDVDILRLRFQRGFSKKFRAYWGATFSNSAGQGVLIDNFVRGGAHDAMKIYGRNEYKLNEKLTLRHRYIDVRNEATVVTPFFFEEQLEIADNNSTQRSERNLHSLELASVRNVADSGKAVLGQSDAWKAHVFYWSLSERFANETTGRIIEHNRSVAGGTFLWNKFTRNYAFSPEITLQNFGADSSTIFLDNRAELLLNLNQQFRPSSKISLTGRFGLAARESFDPLLNFAGSLAVGLKKNLNVYGRIVSNGVFPEPGEFANAIDTLLQANDALKHARMTKLEAGFRFANKKLALHGAARRHHLQNEFILAEVDSALAFANAASGLSYYSLTAFTSWTPANNFEFNAGFDGILGAAPDGSHYQFWYMPTHSFNLAASYSRNIFGGDIFAKLGVFLRGFGERKTPTVWNAGELPTEMQTLPSRQFVDVEAKLFFRDAVIFLRFDNLLGVNDAFWRFSQPMRGRVFRYGLNWTFWD